MAARQSAPITPPDRHLTRNRPVPRGAGAVVSTPAAGVVRCGDVRFTGLVAVGVAGAGAGDGAGTVAIDPAAVTITAAVGVGGDGGATVVPNRLARRLKSAGPVTPS